MNYLDVPKILERIPEVAVVHLLGGYRPTASTAPFPCLALRKLYCPGTLFRPPDWVHDRPTRVYWKHSVYANLTHLQFTDMFVVWKLWDWSGLQSLAHLEHLTLLGQDCEDSTDMLATLEKKIAPYFPASLQVFLLIIQETSVNLAQLIDATAHRWDKRVAVGTYNNGHSRLFRTSRAVVSQSWYGDLTGSETCWAKASEWVERR